MNKLIFDIGMHTGRDTEFYLKKGFNVVAIEANPFLVETSSKKFEKEIQNGQLIIINKAISESNDEEIKFYINKDKDDWGTILPDWNRGMNSNYETIYVKSTTLSSLIEKFGNPYFMKIDIEGADILCLKSLLKTNHTPDYLSIELLTPSNFNGTQNCLEIISHLNALNYRKFQISDQSKNKLVKCPNPSLEGNYVDYSFGGDCSGLFGKELNSTIYSLDEIAQMYLDYFYQKNSPKETLLTKIKRKLGLNQPTPDIVFHPNGWFDLHAIKG